jgi:hypothetical protein
MIGLFFEIDSMFRADVVMHKAHYFLSTVAFQAYFPHVDHRS